MPPPTPHEGDVNLLELLDRVLDKGVVLWGEVTISVADVELIYVGLKLLVGSTETADRLRMAAAERLDLPDGVAVGGTPLTTLGAD